MAIRIEHQPAGAAVGMAAYAGGVGQAKERRRKQLLDIRKDQQRMQFQAGLQERGFGYSRFLQQQREAATTARAKDQREWQAGQAEEGRTFQLGLQERRDRAYTDRDQLDWWQGQGDSLADKVAEIERESGGVFSNDAATQAYKQLQQNLRALEQDKKKHGHLTPIQWHQARAKIYQDYLAGFNRDRDITPWKDRPGSRSTVGGEIWEKSRDPSQPDTFIDFEDEPNLTDEDIRAGKSHRFRYYGGVLHQKVRGRQGTEWKPMESSGPSSSYPEEVADIQTKRSKAYEGVGRSLGYTGEPESWPQPEADKQINQILDKYLPFPAQDNSSTGTQAVDVGDDGSFVIPEDPAPQQPTPQPEGQPQPIPQQPTSPQGEQEPGYFGGGIWPEPSNEVSPPPTQQSEPTEQPAAPPDPPVDDAWTEEDENRYQEDRKRRDSGAEGGQQQLAPLAGEEQPASPQQPAWTDPEQSDQAKLDQAFADKITAKIAAGETITSQEKSQIRQTRLRQLKRRQEEEMRRREAGQPPKVWTPEDKHIPPPPDDEEWRG